MFSWRHKNNDYLIRNKKNINSFGLKKASYPDKFLTYGKCSKISNTKVSDKMIYANSADPDQTAPEGAV